MSDYLIIPYLTLVFVGSRPTQKYDFTRFNVRFLIPTLLVFFWWAGLSSLTINFRYEYTAFNQIIFSLLKLGKLGLYGAAVLLTIYALARSDQKRQQTFLWSILVSSLVVSLMLLISGNSLGSILPSISQNQQVFQENPTSVMMSILTIFLLGTLVQGHGTPMWRRCTTASLVLMAFGFVAAEGRGGWIAALAGMIYIGSQINKKQTFRLTLMSIVLIVLIYNQNQNFRELVDRTINPDLQFLEQYNAGIAGLDDGARWITLYWEIPKLLQDPFLGRGFFHRGGQSGLFSTGSHNFFVQMFLETGVFGGVLILTLFRQMWRHASSGLAVANRVEVPVKATLVAAFVSGLSGEYFYGGMVLFSVFLAYAPVGSMIVKKGAVFLPPTLFYPPSVNQAET